MTYPAKCGAKISGKPQGWKSLELPLTYFHSSYIVVGTVRWKLRADLQANLTKHQRESEEMLNVNIVVESGEDPAGSGRAFRDLYVTFFVTNRYPIQPQMDLLTIRDKKVGNKIEK